MLTRTVNQDNQNCPALSLCWCIRTPHAGAMPIHEVFHQTAEYFKLEGTQRYHGVQHLDSCASYLRAGCCSCADGDELAQGLQFSCVELLAIRP